MICPNTDGRASDMIARMTGLLSNMYRSFSRFTVRQTSFRKNKKKNKKGILNPPLDKKNSYGIIIRMKPIMSNYDFVDLYHKSLYGGEWDA